MPIDLAGREQRVGTSRTLTTGPDGGIVRRTVLPGGLRVISESVPGVRSLAFGVWVGVGSRDETMAQVMKALEGYVPPMECLPNPDFCKLSPGCALREVSLPESLRLRWEHVAPVAPLAQNRATLPGPARATWSIGSGYGLK